MVIFVFYMVTVTLVIIQTRVTGLGPKLKSWETISRSIIWDSVIDNRSHSTYFKKKV